MLQTAALKKKERKTQFHIQTKVGDVMFSTVRKAEFTGRYVWSW